MSELGIIADWIREAPSVVIFTGAGISTESGIPDFRSPGGVWSRYRTVYFEEFLSSAAARHEYWTQKSEAHQQFFDAKPNVGHQTIAKWQREGVVQCVITQNIDGLHQVAGNENVLELHGTARFISCLDCESRYDADPLVKEFLATTELPLCQQCGKDRLKHATVSFGQVLPMDVLERAFQESCDAGLMLAIGSSLVVSPAADLPVQTKRHGGKLVILNRDETPLDGIADAVINESIGETLTELDRMLQKE